MNVQEGEACGLLTTFCFVATMNFNHVVFELDCKIVIEKINTTCQDLTELENIVVGYRKILVTYSYYAIGFVKSQTNGIAHELVRLTPLLPSLYSIDNTIPCIEYLIHNEMR